MRRASALAVIGGLVAGLLAVGLAGGVGAQEGIPSPAQVLTAEVAPTSARPGETFTVTMSGCVGGELIAGLWVPMAADPVVSTGPLSSDADPVVGTLTVPLGAAPIEAEVVVFCSLDEEAFVAVPVQILAAITTTTVPPAVGATPTFTG